MDKLNLKNGTIEFKAQDSKAELYFFGDIVSDKWSKWTDEDKCPSDVLELLSQINNYDNVDVHINSGGGSAFGGIAIHNILKRHNGKITTYIDGLAASAASVIALAGDVVKMPTSSQLMIHKPWGGCYGTAAELRTYANCLDSCQESIMQVYVNNLNNETTRETIEKMVNAETWLTATEAQKYFTNIEIEEQGQIVACTSQYFNSYKNTPSNFVSAKQDVKKVNKNINSNTGETEQLKKLLLLI